MSASPFSISRRWAPGSGTWRMNTRSTAGVPKRDSSASSTTLSLGFQPRSENEPEAAELVLSHS
jgi:hypothetical protein